MCYKIFFCSCVWFRLLTCDALFAMHNRGLSGTTCDTDSDTAITVAEIRFHSRNTPSPLWVLPGY